MRKIVALITLVISLSASLQANAEYVNGPEGIETVDQQDLCEAYGELAASFMEANQVGMPLSKVIEIASVEKGTLTYDIMLAAYEQRRFSSEAFQVDWIATFRNEIEVACYKHQNQ